MGVEDVAGRPTVPGRHGAESDRGIVPTPPVSDRIPVESRPLSVGAASLFTWHVPLPHLSAGRDTAALREREVREALRSICADTVEHHAIALITSGTARAGECAQALSLGSECDPFVRAALLQAFARAVLEEPSVQFPPAAAYEAVNEAISLLEVENEVRAEETAEPIPPEVVAALTATFVRAALTVGDVEAARPAADALAQMADGIPAEHVRFHALTSAAIAFLNDGRPDEALIPSQRARSLARLMGDLAGVWRAERIRAHVASVTGRPQAEEAAHREVAALARRLADDLMTEPSLRAEASVSELESRSVLVRIGLSAGRFAEVDDHARGLLDRVAKARELGDAPAEQLWEYEIDARVARMIAAGMPDSPLRGRHCAPVEQPVRGRRRRGSAAPSTEPLTIEERASNFKARRREARTAIAEAPETKRERALWWDTYVDDRYAYLLAVHGRYQRALRVAERAHSRWANVGDLEQQERVGKDIARLHEKIRAAREGQ